MEWVLPLRPMRRRVGERADDMPELKYRSGPAMRHEERQCICLRRAHMQEVNAKPVDRSPVLPKVVEQCLATPPVVAVAPTGAEGLDLCQLWPLAGIAHCLGIRPARTLQTSSEIVQIRLRDR